LLATYDEHHVLKAEEEKVMGVKKESYNFLKRKLRESNMRFPFQGLTNF
jgi:hypothetical protein